MKYWNFELSVDARSDGAFEGRSRSPGGKAKSRLSLPFDSDELLRRHGELEQAIEHSRPGLTMLERHLISSAIATARDAGVRIRLRLEPPEIPALPWHTRSHAVTKDSWPWPSAPS